MQQPAFPSIDRRGEVIAPSLAWANPALVERHPPLEAFRFLLPLMSPACHSDLPV